MSASPRRVPEVDELAEDISEIKSAISKIEEKLDARYVPREVYEARHTSLRSEVALELANIMSQMEGIKNTSESARSLAMWAVGLMASLVIASLVTFVTVGGVGG